MDVGDRAMRADRSGVRMSVPSSQLKTYVNLCKS
jgi:hypothetical protein